MVGGLLYVTGGGCGFRGLGGGAIEHSAGTCGTAPVWAAALQNGREEASVVKDLVLCLLIFKVTLCHSWDVEKEAKRGVFFIILKDKEEEKEQRWGYQIRYICEALQ